MTRKYGGKSSDERRAERRERVLDAALELYGTKGYRVTSINDVCALAHVTTRHFYQEFESAENLLFELYVHITETSSGNVVEAIAAAPPDPESVIRAGLGAYLRTMIGDPRNGRVMGLESVGVSDKIEAKRREVRGAFADFLASQAFVLNPHSALEPDTTRRVALVLVGGISETVIDQLRAAEPTPFEQLAKELSAITLAVCMLGADSEVRAAVGAQPDPTPAV